MGRDTDDRIKLAEAMGWVCTEHDVGGPTWNKGGEIRISPGLGMQIIELPDPYTDANDDYAVLEWMKNENDKIDDGESQVAEDAWKVFLKQFEYHDPTQYHVGDYARAALKVIDDG